MIKVGYLAKKVAQRPDWLKVPGVKDIYSVSNCISAAFMDYIKFWRHNGYWFFDTPQVILELAKENNINLGDLTLFYYEVYEKEFDEQQQEWLGFAPDDFPINVTSPAKSQFQGYDVVSFSVGTNPECSPLSCNHLAGEISTNSHCLLDSFEDAKQALESGRFDHTEPGPFRMFAVYTIDPYRWR